MLHLNHGFGASASSWAGVMGELSRRLHAVAVAHDTPGFGLTSRPGLWRIGRYSLGNNAGERRRCPGRSSKREAMGFVRDVAGVFFSCLVFPVSCGRLVLPLCTSSTRLGSVECSWVGSFRGAEVPDVAGDGATDARVDWCTFSEVS